MHQPDRVGEYTSKGWWTNDTVQQLFVDRVEEFGDEIAAIDPANKATLVDLEFMEVSWNQLDEKVDDLAAVLLSFGIGEGSVVALQLPNIFEQIVAFMALWRVRAIISPLPVQYRRHEIVEVGNIAKFDALLTVDRLTNRMLAAEAVALADEIPSLRTILHFGGGDVAGSVYVRLDASTNREANHIVVSAYVAEHPVDPNDCITICWTSGTESRPKGVPRAHYEWLSMCLDTVYSPDLSHASRMLNPFPMVNMAGINGMLLPWLTVGCVLIQHHPFDLQVFLEQIEQEKVTYTVAPPALLAMLLKNDELLAKFDISTLTQIGSGSAPLQEWMVRGWYERYGIEIINYFGSNEGISLMTDVKLMTRPEQRASFFPRYGGERHWTFPAAQRTTIKLVDRDTGEEVVEPGRAGELYLKGPGVFSGYVDGADLPSPFDDEGFLKTGDLFVIDGENDEFLRYVDRAKDLIIRGGMNIAPAELETLIASHPDVAEVAVVGYPDEVMGERVCAVVVVKPDRSLTLEAVVEHLRAQEIATYKLPERMELRDALPRNPVGKVLKRQLRDEVRETVLLESVASD
jgi:acyl-CoA synthetase (AMP-forming)/AMP-acid ligase II